MIDSYSLLQRDNENRIICKIDGFSRRIRTWTSKAAEMLSQPDQQIYWEQCQVLLLRFPFLNLRISKFLLLKLPKLKQTVMFQIKPSVLSYKGNFCWLLKNNLQKCFRTTIIYLQTNRTNTVEKNLYLKLAIALP